MHFTIGTLMYLGGPSVKELIYLTKGFSTGQTQLHYKILIKINLAGKASIDISPERMFHLNKNGTDAAFSSHIILRAPTSADIGEFLSKLPKISRKAAIKNFIEALKHLTDIDPSGVRAIEKVAKNILESN